ncbi:MAG: glutamine-hydrolyzing GMP synthase [Candidatus Neomarinimicrobiota bacterium]
MTKGGICILDFGSQYTQLIARRIREQHVYSEILPANVHSQEIRDRSVAAIILSGGPSSVYESGSPEYDKNIFDLDIPILGICYGLHLLVQHYGGIVKSSKHGEYGYAHLKLLNHSSMFSSVQDQTQVWMSHSDIVTQIPDGWDTLATTNNNIIAALSNDDQRRYAVQFHPEVAHTIRGEQILNNFLFRIAGCQPDWTTGNFVDDQVTSIRSRVGNEKVLCAVSGGVDSSVVSALLKKAIGTNSIAVLIDHGLMRQNEVVQCKEILGKELGVNIHVYDESKFFLNALKNIRDPEIKRKIIGEQFIRSFEAIAGQFDNVKFLAQGTLYPDVVESGTLIRGGQTAVIKSHHNVGGLPDEMDFELIEPLRDLFKDEVRNIGKELGLPESLLNRHPFPGPGLAVRILGKISKNRLNILRKADEIFLDILREERLYDDIWQAFTVLIPIKTVGVMGDKRTYEYVIALRAVTSSDGMTADWYNVPADILLKISNKIVNSVPGVNRVVYDVTSKPPGTIEWE